MATTNFEAAIQKAQVKRDVAAQLQTLPKEAQRDVLADLLLSLDEKDPPKTFVVRLSDRVADPGQLTIAVAGRPTGAIATTGTGRTDLVVKTLKEHPGTSIGELAAIVYPGQKEATHKVRAILWSLKKQKRAHNPQPGKWELTEKK